MASFPEFKPSRAPSFDELADHLTKTSPLTRSESERVIAEVLVYFSESVKDFVVRRHRELKARGIRNEEAFELIESEIKSRRFKSEPLTIRQLRRIIYS